MIGTFLSSVLALFLVTTTPAMVTQNASLPVLVRNLAVTLFVTVMLMTMHWYMPLTLFLTGVCVCGGIALYQRKDGVKLLLLEPAMIILLFWLIVFMKEDAGGLFSGRGIGPTLSHLEGMLYKGGIPIQSEHFGLFTAGGIIGIFASIPARPRLLRQLAAIGNHRALKRTRALPEAAVFGNRIFAPWRIIQRSRRRLSARIDRVTQR